MSLLPKVEWLFSYTYTCFFSIHVPIINKMPMRPRGEVKLEFAPASRIIDSIRDVLSCVKCKKGGAVISSQSE